MKKIFLISAAVLAGTAAFAQSAIDAYRLSQPDMKGTARFMSMGGAFTALGGDLSTISQNPAGIGIYRNNEAGFTLDLDLQHSDSQSGDFKDAVNQTKFYLNNVGFVWTMKLPTSSFPNVNFGFTYNKSASFNRRYRGTIGLNNSTQSLSNYIAFITSVNGYSEDMLKDDYPNYDPYNPDYGYAADWLSILGYQGGVIENNPEKWSPNNYDGLWPTNGSKEVRGTGYFDVIEKGGVDSYNIAIGGNISNIVFWGMDFDITHLSYTLEPTWNETIMTRDNNGQFGVSDSWSLQNYYNCSGTGFNYKLGVIVKPIQEIRLGFAFHTPTWYGLKETFYGELYNSKMRYPAQTNNGILGYNDVNLATPWKLTAGVAAVLFNSLIISADYEWNKYDGMKFSEPAYGDYGYYPDDPWDDPWYPGYPYYSKARSKEARYISGIAGGIYGETNNEVKQIYRSTNTFRVGAEYRIIPQFSVRAGYAHVSSPVRAEMEKDNREIYTPDGKPHHLYPFVTTAGTIPNYRFDNTTDYITCGLGFKIKKFYVDVAYVYKHMTSQFHAYSSWYGAVQTMAQDKFWVGNSPTSKLNFSNSQIVLSAGIKF